MLVRYIKYLTRFVVITTFRVEVFSLVSLLSYREIIFDPHKTANSSLNTGKNALKLKLEYLITGRPKITKVGDFA